MSNSLPTGWLTTTIGFVCENKVAQGPPENARVPYIDISSIDRSTKRVSGTTLVTGTDAPTRARQWVRKDDVLVSMTRPNLNAVAQVGPELDGAVASTGFDVLRPRAVDSRWIFYRVRTNAFVADVCEGLQGVVYPAIRPHDVRRHQVPLPPLPEQRRIVSTIESYFTRLDDAVTTLERVQRNLTRYRASVLKAAVEGRLLPTEAELARAEGRSYEPASVLLERILAERRRRWEDAELAKMTAKGKVSRDDKWKSKYAEPVAPDPTELPELAEGWCWATLDQLTELIEGGTSITATSQATPRRVLRSSSVRQGSVDLADIRFLPIQAPVADDAFLNEGELLFTRLSGTLAYVGNCAVVPPLAGLRLEFPDRLFRARVSVLVRGDFVSSCFGVAHLRRRLEDAAKSTAGHQRISLSDLKEFCIPLPPFVEQARIAESVGKQLSVIAAAEKTALANTKRCTHLRQSILKWAFEGRLVDQDPSDEPASVLLDRIRAERLSTSESELKPARKRRPRAARQNAGE